MRSGELARATGAEHFGAEVELSRVSSFAGADENAAVFAMSPEALVAAMKCAAGAVIAGEFARSLDSGASGIRKALLIYKQPKVAFARASTLLAPVSKSWETHPAAVIAASAKIGRPIGIAAYAVIEDGAEIGGGTRIGAHCVISQGVRIGRDCTLHPGVTVYSGTAIGDRVVVHAGAVLGSDGFGYVRDDETGKYEQFPQIGRLVIEDDVEIGANTAIDRGALDETVVRRGTKIDNLVHIAHNVAVGEDVVIAAQTGVSGSSVIERGAIIAGQVGIADHVRIEEGVVLGAQCGVPSGKVVRGKGVLFWGTPARPIKEYLRQLAVLARLAKKS